MYYATLSTVCLLHFPFHRMRVSTTFSVFCFMYTMCSPKLLLRCQKFERTFWVCGAVDASAFVWYTFSSSPHFVLCIVYQMAAACVRMYKLYVFRLLSKKHLGVDNRRCVYTHLCRKPLSAFVVTATTNMILTRSRVRYRLNEICA